MKSVKTNRINPFYPLPLRLPSDKFLSFQINDTQLSTLLSVIAQDKEDEFNLFNLLRKFRNILFRKKGVKKKKRSKSGERRGRILEYTEKNENEGRSGGKLLKYFSLFSSPLFFPRVENFEFYNFILLDAFPSLLLAWDFLIIFL